MISYAAHKENQTFIHAHLGLGKDALKPYKQMIDRWLWPDVLRNQDTSVAKAKQAISHYQKAVGEPAGLAELRVFYCELAAGFCKEFGNDDEDYLNALVRIGLTLAFGSLVPGIDNWPHLGGLAGSAAVGALLKPPSSASDLALQVDHSLLAALAVICFSAIAALNY